MKTYQYPVLKTSQSVQLAFLQAQYLHCGPLNCETGAASFDLGYSCSANRLDFFIIDPGSSFADCQGQLNQTPSCILTATINGSPLILNNLTIDAGEGVTNCFNTLNCDGEVLWEGLFDDPLIDCTNLTAVTAECPGDPPVTCDDINN